MCGRMNITDSVEIQNFFASLGVDFRTKDNRDLRPTQDVATLAYLDGGVRQLDTKWGIKLAWSKKLLINAQGETVATKKTFKNAFIHNRCLIPYTGWYEWRDEGGPRKQCYSFTREDGKPFLMCGVWYKAVETPELVTLTITPSLKCAEIHGRMPLLIDPVNIDPWLQSSVEDVQPLMVPADDSVIRIDAVA